MILEVLHPEMVGKKLQDGKSVRERMRKEADGFVRRSLKTIGFKNEFGLRRRETEKLMPIITAYYFLAKGRNILAIDFDGIPNSLSNRYAILALQTHPGIIASPESLLQTAEEWACGDNQTLAKFLGERLADVGDFYTLDDLKEELKEIYDELIPL